LVKRFILCSLLPAGFLIYVLTLDIHASAIWRVGLGEVGSAALFIGSAALLRSMRDRQ
jgi:hypothetical protein